VRRLALQWRNKLRRAAIGIGNKLPFGRRSQQPLGSLFAILIIGPSSPCKHGQKEQNNGENNGIALHGDKDLFTPIVLARAERGNRRQPNILWELRQN